MRIYIHDIDLDRKLIFKDTVAHGNNFRTVNERTSGHI